MLNQFFYNVYTICMMFILVVGVASCAGGASNGGNSSQSVSISEVDHSVILGQLQGRVIPDMTGYPVDYETIDYLGNATYSDQLRKMTAGFRRNASMFTRQKRILIDMQRSNYDAYIVSSDFISADPSSALKEYDGVVHPDNSWFEDDSYSLGIYFLHGFSSIFIDGDDHVYQKTHRLDSFGNEQTGVYDGNMYVFLNEYYADRSLTTFLGSNLYATWDSLLDGGQCWVEFVYDAEGTEVYQYEAHDIDTSDTGWVYEEVTQSKYFVLDYSVNETRLTYDGKTGDGVWKVELNHFYAQFFYDQEMIVSLDIKGTDQMTYADGNRDPLVDVDFTYTIAVYYNGIPYYYYGQVHREGDQSGNFIFFGMDLYDNEDLDGEPVAILDFNQDENGVRTFDLTY